MDSVGLYNRAGITAILGIALGVIGLLTCIKARRRKDPARVAVPWLQATIGLVFISWFFTVVNSVADAATDRVIVSMTRIPMFGSKGIWDDLSFVSDIIKRLFDRLSDITLIMTLAEMGNGFVSALKDSSRPSRRKLVRILAAISTVPLLALALTIMGLRAHLSVLGLSIVISNDDAGLSDDANRKSIEIGNGRKTLDELNLAYPCICIVILSGLVVQASIVKHKYRQHGYTDQNSNLYLAAACLQILNCVWDVTRAALDSSMNAFMDIAGEIVLGVVPLFVALVLLFIIVIRKKDGLWTTSQPWMMQEDINDRPKIDIPSDETVTLSHQEDDGSPKELFTPAQDPRFMSKPPVEADSPKPPVEADTSSPRTLLEMPGTQTEPMELNAQTEPVELDSTEKRIELVG